LRPVRRWEKAPVTARAAEEEPRRATVDISGRERSRSAAAHRAVAAAAKPEEEEPKPTFDRKEFSLSKRTPASISARSRTWSTTASRRSAPRPVTRSPSTTYTSSPPPNSTVVVVRLGAVQTLMLSW
jgi:hypothetical protein